MLLATRRQVVGWCVVGVMMMAKRGNKKLTTTFGSLAERRQQRDSSTVAMGNCCSFGCWFPIFFTMHGGEDTRLDLVENTDHRCPCYQQ